MKKSAYILFILVSVANMASAQDPSFSQFFASPLSLNPALTGNFNGDMRAAGNYRNQWANVNNAYVTSTVSVDFPLLQNKLKEGDRWAMGIMAMNDKTANGILTSNYFSLSTAYHKVIDQDGLHKISLGFQGTYASKMLDGPRLHFLDGLQLDGSWLPSSSEPENLKVSTSKYFDVNAGGLYNGSFNGINEVYVGAALYHITQPKESFLGMNNVSVPMRFTAHAGGYFPTQSQGVTLYVSALYNQQASASELVFGGAVEINAGSDGKKTVNIYFGAWGRVNNVSDAIIPYVGLDYGNFSLGMTYDINISSFKMATHGNGGQEISLIYNLVKLEHALDNKLQCPRF